MPLIMCRFTSSGMVLLKLHTALTLESPLAQLEGQPWLCCAAATWGMLLS